MARPLLVVFMASGTIKFVVTESGELLIIPHTVDGTEISHAVIANGASVIAAGEADIAANGGTYVGIDISNQSGHYRPSESSLEIARELFAQHGITFL